MSAPFYVEKIKYCSRNELGYDYVIGDIHGRYDLVEKALELVHFNPLTDRLFCVGDLIDRGRDSWKVLEFLQRPYVYALRGNHEDMLLDLYNVDEPLSDEMLHFYSGNIGLEWWFDVSLENREKIIAEIKKLPLIIEVDSQIGKIGLIHADIDESLSWDRFKEAINNNEKSDIEEAMWGRTRLLYENEIPIEGVERVYAGHTTKAIITPLANFVGIDTGAVFNQHLTIANLICPMKYFQKANMPFGNVHVINHIH
jgi:serine/threonine protein phosphatase 1